jgi:hypothetical protein
MLGGWTCEEPLQFKFTEYTFSLGAFTEVILRGRHFRYIDEGGDGECGWEMGI